LPKDQVGCSVVMFAALYIFSVIWASARQMLIQTINSSINASGGGLQVGILAAFGEAMFQVAQFDDQAFDDRFQAALVVDLASSDDGGGVHGEILGSSALLL
jgi:hypothetical protein